jgi:hypothetical protein
VEERAQLIKSRLRGDLLCENVDLRPRLCDPAVFAFCKRAIAPSTSARVRRANVLSRTQTA